MNRTDPFTSPPRLGRARPRLMILSLAAWMCGASFACSGNAPNAQVPRDPLADLRAHAPRNPTADSSAQWLLAELLAPGGDAKLAMRAREQLDRIAEPTLHGHLAKALDDTVHGRLARAPDHFLRSAALAAHSAEADAPLLAWYAIERAVALRGNTEGLFERWRDWIETMLEQPNRLGYRARDLLVDWWLEEAWSNADRDLETLAVQHHGCLPGVRLAGPFGNGAVANALRSFPAESTAPWPHAWPEDPTAANIPSVLESQQEGCEVSSDEPSSPGIFYAEARFALEEPQRAILHVDEALAIWVDGAQVLDRSIREWGSWTRTGVALDLSEGNHRVVAKLLKPKTSVQLMHLDGRPLRATTLDNPTRHFVQVPPRVALEINELRRYVASGGITPPASPLLAYVAAHLSDLEGEPEAATLLLEPLVQDHQTATGVVLARAAQLVKRDPIFEDTQAESLSRELHQRALERDPELWESDLSRIVALAKTQGPSDALRQLRKLAKAYPQVPGVLGALAMVYGELGWTPEHHAVVKLRAERFPDDVEGLYAAAQVLEEQGQQEAARGLYQRIRSLDPDTEIFVGRALEQQDYQAALEELERLRHRRPGQKALLEKLDEIRKRAGDEFDWTAALERAIADAPKNGRTRLALADARYAAGDAGSLQRALIDAVEAGAGTGPLKHALYLVEGMTEFERHRLDTQQVLREYEASGQQLDANAARVLDYMVAWIHSDGTTRMLEHEIVRLQSAEAVRRFAEQDLGSGVVLKARVLKREGTILEPELVAGKPTVTFPHLEVGDYIETERILTRHASANGSAFDGLQWFFREKDVAYARSELVLIAPQDKQLDILPKGRVPEPVTQLEGPHQIIRWRLDQSPAAPSEPLSVPPSEYLPNVRISWGVELPRRLSELANLVARTVPLDPRIVKIAEGILEPVRAGSELERARALYRWVLSNIQAGDEDDPRRAIVGKRGNRWKAFALLCEAAQIPAKWVLARNALAPEPSGPAEQAEQFNQTALRVGSGPFAWVELDHKYTPFGYLSAPARNMPGYLLDLETQEAVQVPDTGSADRLEFTGQLSLQKDGAARLQLTEVFSGRHGASLRRGISELGERRVRDVLESQVLSAHLKGARLIDYALPNLDTIDEPLRVEMTAEMAHFASSQRGALRLNPPFVLPLSQLASLPRRQTPILLPASQDWRVELSIELPPDSRVESLRPRRIELQQFLVEIEDHVVGDRLILKRRVHLPAGRVAVPDYERFVRFTRAADAALSREVVIIVPSG